MNDIGIIVTSKLKLDIHINQRLSKAQQKRIFLEEKRSFFHKYESKSKFIQKLNFYQFSVTRQMYGSQISHIAKN